MKFHNLVRMYTTTAGDSDVTLTTAVPGCKTFAEAGVSDSAEVHYGIISYDLTTHRPTASEVGVGTYISSGTVLKRTTVENSTDSDDSAISLSGLAEVYICPTALDFNTYIPFAFFRGIGVSTITNTNNAILEITSTSDAIDEFSLCTLVDSDDTLTLNYPGWYQVQANIGHYSNGTAYDGVILTEIIVTGEASATPGDAYQQNGYVAAWGVITDDPLIVMSPLFRVDNITTTVKVRLTNNSGQSIDAYINNIVVKKFENL